jgi:hypothetical protein
MFMPPHHQVEEGWEVRFLHRVLGLCPSLHTILGQQEVVLRRYEKQVDIGRT